MRTCSQPACCSWCGLLTAWGGRWEIAIELEFIVVSLAALLTFVLCNAALPGGQRMSVLDVALATVIWLVVSSLVCVGIPA